MHEKVGLEHSSDSAKSEITCFYNEPVRGQPSASRADAPPQMGPSQCVPPKGSQGLNTCVGPMEPGSYIGIREPGPCIGIREPGPCIGIRELGSCIGIMEPASCIWAP